MRNYIAIMSISLCILACTTQNVYRGKKFKGKSAVDVYHGISIEDPYRNLENLNDTTVLSWLESQNNYANNILDNLSGRDALLETQKKIEKDKQHSVLQIRAMASGKHFYLKKFAEENVFNVYYRDSLQGKEQKIFDVEKYSIDRNEDYIINYIKPDWSGNKVAISISKKGNEISEIIVLDVVKKLTAPEIYTNAAPASVGGIDWLSDDSGFITSYLPYTNPNDEKFWLDTKSYLYMLGDVKGKDIFSKENNPELSLQQEDFPVVYNHSNDDGYLFGQYVGKSRYLNIYYIAESDVDHKNFKWKTLSTESEKITQYKTDRNYIYYLTSENGSVEEIRKTAIENPDFENAEVLVTASPESTISDFELTKDGLFYVQVKNGIEARLFHKNNAQTTEITLPGTSGKIFIGSLGASYDDLWVTTRGWVSPVKMYKYDINKNSFTETGLIGTNSYEGFEDLIAEEIEITSHDGTALPVSLIYKKSLQKNKQNRVLFYGYGSYGSSLSPFYSTSFLLWVKEGGVIAMPHVRGGGEKGEAWHKAGMKTTKSNTWKDLIATVKYMIDNEYTTNEKTVVWGTSAGGIMAGRAITERPDLFKVMVGIAPSMNMIRSEVQPNGLNSIKEFGTLKDSLEFQALLEMDSYHAIQKNKEYPAVLILAGLKDARVVAWDPAKFVARLLDSSNSNAPILFQIDINTGHGGINNSQDKILKDYANIFAFALWQTGHPDYQLNAEAINKK